jgi:hypothetical protein
MLEFNLGKGKILVTTLGILNCLGKNIGQAGWAELDKAKQFSSNQKIEAKYFLQCLVDYAKGSAFVPVASVPKAEFLKLFSPRQEKSPEAPKELLKVK